MPGPVPVDARRGKRLYDAAGARASCLWMLGSVPPGGGGGCRGAGACLLGGCGALAGRSPSSESNLSLFEYVHTHLKYHPHNAGASIRKRPLRQSVQRKRGRLSVYPLVAATSRIPASHGAPCSRAHLRLSMRLCNTDT